MVELSPVDFVLSIANFDAVDCEMSLVVKGSVQRVVVSDVSSSAHDVFDKLPELEFHIGNAKMPKGVTRENNDDGIKEPDDGCNDNKEGSSNCRVKSPNDEHVERETIAPCWKKPTRLIIHTIITRGLFYWGSLLCPVGIWDLVPLLSF
ncbi:hypothetical protein U1Q18_020819 [Sarracenia purpurea var. burkii]